MKKNFNYNTIKQNKIFRNKLNKENFKNLNKDGLCSWSEDVKDGNTCQIELRI